LLYGIASASRNTVKLVLTCWRAILPADGYVGGSMPRSVMVGLLAAVGAVMAALVGLARGDLVWVIVAALAAATGLAASLPLLPSIKKS